MLVKSLNRVGIRFLIWGFLAISLFAFTSPAVMQTAGETWAVPVNLSQSGSAVDPQMVVDSNGIAHVLWQDTAKRRFIYTRGVPGDWSTPVTVELPFGTRQFFPELREEDPTPLFSPYLVADAVGRIHAFWIDDDKALRYSWVSADEFANYPVWSPRLRLADDVSKVVAAVDGSNQVHLGFVRAAADDTLPAGIFYRRLDSVETDWSNPILLYESDYYQNTPSDRTNLQMVLTSIEDQPHVYMVWDNRSLEKLFLTRSTDGGETWQELAIIDQRLADDGPDIIGPSNIKILADGEDLLLIWQAGHDLDSCSQYYQLSTDGGNSWGAPQVMLEELQGCPEQTHFVRGTEDPALLFVIHQGQPYLLAWDGNRWGDLQAQGNLASFINPETYRSISFGCQQFALLNQRQLLVVGCSTAPDEGLSDTWHMTRPLGSTDEWYPPPPAWLPATIVSSSAFAITSPKLAADDQGELHAFWSQPRGSEDRDNTTVIHYARWDGESWLGPVPILSSPIGNAQRPEVTISNDNRLMTIWIDDTGQIFFSQSDSERAIFASDWSEPATIPSLASMAGGADIAVDSSDTIYVAFAIPVNENRGIYLTKSVDNGNSWLEPVSVLDGSTADWDVVGVPHLALSNDGVVHLLWTKDSLSPAETKSQALFYARSEDKGATFDEPELVVETPIVWFEIVSGEGSAIHRLWQEQLATSTGLRHEYSIDSGQSWSSPTRITDIPSPVDVTADGKGQLHLIQVNNEEATYHIWNGNKWSLGESLELTPSSDATADRSGGVAAAVSLDEALFALFTSDLPKTGASEDENGLFAAWRAIEVPEAITIPTPAVTAPAPVTAPTIEATPTSSLAATSTSTPLPSPTSSATGNLNSGGDEGSGFLNANSSIVRTAIAFLPAALLLLIVAAAAIWITRRASGR